MPPNIRWIFARFIDIGSGTELARELAARGIQHQPWQPDRQEVPVSPAEQPRLHRRGRAQGRQLSRRA